MSNQKTGFSLFNKTQSSGKRSLQIILDNSGEKQYNSNRFRDVKKSPIIHRNSQNRPLFTKETKRPFSSKFDAINTNPNRKQLVFGKKTNDDNKESRSPNYRLKSKTEFTNQTRKVFRSKFDVINETQDRKQLVFGKKPNYDSKISEPTKFRDRIIDPIGNSENNDSNQSHLHGKSKKKTEIEIYREHLKKIEGNDSWDLYEDPSITTFVLGNHVIEFKNLTPEQFKLYQSVVQMTNIALDNHMRKKIDQEEENIDPEFKHKHNVIDKLWRNPDVPLQSWDYVLPIIDKMNYDYKKFIKEYIEIDGEEKTIMNQLRNINKKLKKIKLLEKKLENGKNLNSDQKDSIESKTHYLLKKSIYESWLAWMNEESEEEETEE
jgi:hypothetical protein